MELEIKIISKEILKPSSPTPPHLKTLTLSFFDQIFPKLHMPLLLFYTTNPKTPSFNITTLKNSLRETLSHFYPLAGRCIDDSHVSCNDEGVHFVETFVNYRLADLLSSSNKLDVIHKFLNHYDSEYPASFQINVFACGGVVIGCYMLHKLLDAASFSTFLQFWAALASKGNHTVVAVEPNFNAITKVFPPQPTIDLAPPVIDLSKKPNKNFQTLVRCFRLTNDAIASLKERAISEAVPHPTSFESIAGFIWENIVNAAHNTRASIPESTMLKLSMNMRPRINPPLPKESIGNCLVNLVAKAIGLKTFPCLVKEIHEQIINAKFKIEKFQGENGIQEFCLHRDQVNKEGNESVYDITSWCRLGINEADFGLGKPKWISTDGRPPPGLRNFIVLSDYNDAQEGSRDGVDVCLILEENEMRFLESNQQFLEYASIYG